MPATPETFEPPDEAASEEASVPYEGVFEGEPETGIGAVRARHEPEIAAIDGVMGVAVGRTQTGEDALVVYMRDPSVRSRVPSEVEGHPVETVVTGVIDAYGAEPE